MKIIVTGSLGNISKPLTQELVQKGHSVTVISSKSEKQKEIEALGATAAIGLIEDINFLSTVFKGADAVYCMEPPVNFFDPDFELVPYYNNLAHSYRQAIQQSGVQRMVHLSSIGAHTNKGNGMLVFHHNVENILKQLPSDVSISFVRPVGFYYNLFSQLRNIKTQGFIATNFGGATKEPWVSPIDIASAIAEEIETHHEGRKVRYVASDEITSDETASILGAAIGKPDLKWNIISDEQFLNNLIAIGMNPKVAKGFVETQANQRTGELYEDYYRHKPTLGKVKMTDFAKEFASRFHSN